MPFSLCGLGVLDIDTQLNFLEIEWIYILLNPINALWKVSYQCSQGSQNLFSDPSPLGGGIKFCKFIEFPLKFWI